MPLRDHFHPPLANTRSWEELHGQWPAVIVQHLVRTLPEQYVAAPRIHLGAEWEVDVAAFDRDSDSTRVPDGDSGVATMWATRPHLAVETEMGDEDEYEVRVFDIRRERRLVAAIELVSPRNKDRPESRGQFVAKCAALLRKRVSVTIVDLVTVRQANLYGQLLELIGQSDPAFGPEPTPTYAAACRWGARPEGRWLEVWRRPLVVGEPLPVLPLWLGDDVAIELDLEAAYEQTCRDLRIS
jgi:hypothetical protein